MLKLGNQLVFSVSLAMDETSARIISVFKQFCNFSFSGVTAETLWALARILSFGLKLSWWEGFEIFMLKEYASIVIYGSFLKL